MKNILTESEKNEILEMHRKHGYNNSLNEQGEEESTKTALEQEVEELEALKMELEKTKSQLVSKKAIVGGTLRMRLRKAAQRKRLRQENKKLAADLERLEKDIERLESGKVLDSDNVEDAKFIGSVIGTIALYITILKKDLLRMASDSLNPRD